MIWIHVSELSIDRLVAGELPPADVAAMRDHAASCARCNALLVDALSAKHELLPRLPLPRRRAPLVAAISAVTALAAGGMLVAAWPHGEATGVRAKGSAVLGFYVAHQGQVRLGGPHEAIDRGDAIELYTTTSTPAWVAVVGADHTVYLPPTVVPASHEHLLPMSIVIDSSDTLTALFCSERFDPLAPPADCTSDRVSVVTP